MIIFFEAEKMEMEYLNNRIYRILLAQVEEKHPCVLTTVTAAMGSTPQKPGCTALFNQTGLMAGTVGGGFVENQIALKAAEALQSKKPGLFDFNLAHDINDESGAICGGGMSVLLDARPEKHQKVWAQLNDSVEKREPGVLVTLCRFAKEEKQEIERMWVTLQNKEQLSVHFDEKIMQEIVDMLKNPVNGAFRNLNVQPEPGSENFPVLLETIVPMPRLIIAGAGHVGKALSHYAHLLDFEVTVWDDRPDLANPVNLPDAGKILNGTVEECFSETVVDNQTFIVIVTRGHKNDADVLKKFIHSGAGYIGMIGSKRKVAQVKEKFISQGWATPEQWEKIYAPIGIDIHSKTVQEIALSIAAQLVKVRYENNYHE